MIMAAAGRSRARGDGSSQNAACNRPQVALLSEHVFAHPKAAPPVQRN